MHFWHKATKAQRTSNNHSANKTHFEVLCDFESLWQEEDQGNHQSFIIFAMT
jgi:hypothetical protein